MRARITNQQIAANQRSNEAILRAMGRAGSERLATRNPDAVEELLKALRWDKLRAIGHDQPLPPEFWDAQSSADPGTWPAVRFLREDVLRLWPAIDTAAAEGGSRASLEAMAGKEAAAQMPSHAPQSVPDAADVRNMSPAETGRAGGIKSGEVRRADRKWVSQATALAKAACSRNPAASHAGIARDIANSWNLDDGDCQGDDTLARFVSSMRKNGELPQRRPSLRKRRPSGP
jgi:hypothetical protein